jgi:hypothetical protein
MQPNPQNEIWLDVRTDASGSGTSRTTVPFVFTDWGPGSVVVGDAAQTSLGEGRCAGRLSHLVSGRLSRGVRDKAWRLAVAITGRRWLEGCVLPS